MKDDLLFILLICVITLSFSSALNGQLYKEMMEDYNYNFYDVVAEANRYFDGKEKGKGTGWKGFQRWKYKNEPLFAPSGDRSQFNPIQLTRSSQQLRRTATSNYSTNNNYDWKDLGPYSADSVTTHWAPGIGRVECVYVDPANANTIYISSRSGGFWRSVNGGLTWQNTTDHLPATGVNTFAVNPDNPSDILINVRNALNSTTQGIYRSLDGGLNWILTAFNPQAIGVGGPGTNHRVNEITFHHTRTDSIYIATTEGLYRSTDNFLNIDLIKSGSYGSVEIHPVAHDIVYLTHDYYWSRNRFWRSVDGGTTFTEMPEIIANDYSYPKLSTTAADPALLFFTSGKGIWKSIDSGLTFNFIPGSDQYGSTFGVSDLDEDILLKGVLDVFKSSDGGINWSQSTTWLINNSNGSNYVHADMRYVYVTNGVFYIGTDGYMAKSTDNGVSWTILSNGTGIRENYKLGICQTDNSVASCGSQDNGSSYYIDGQWIEWVGADGMEQIIHPMDRNLAIANIQNGEKYRTLDGAQNIQNINGNHEEIDFYWVAPLAFHPMDFNRIFSGGTKLLESTDFGETWNTLHDFGAVVKKMAIAENDKNILVASIDEELYKSINGGATFTRVDDAGITTPTYSITDIAFDPGNDDRIIVTYGNYRDDNQRIFMTEDGGLSWQNISYNLSSLPAYSVVIDHSIVPIIYIGTEFGVYTMALGGNSYQLFSNNLPPVAIYEMEINYGANSIKAATWGRGLWETTLQGRAGYVDISKVEFDNLSAFGLSTSVECNAIIHVDNEILVDTIYVQYSINNILLDIPKEVNRFSKYGYTFEMPSATLGDTIYFKIFAKNSNGDVSESYRFMYIITDFPEYCIAQGSTGTGSDYIDRVNVGLDEYLSGKTQYSDFTNVIFEIGQYNNEIIKVRLNYAFIPDSAFAWVDWNRTGTFDDSEQIFFTSYINKEAEGTIIQPLGTVPGDYRLRVRNNYFDASSPCGTTAGEVEDYTLRVIPGCPKDMVVTTLDDIIPGSLRYWVDASCPGDTIYFSNELIGDTISLWDGLIDIDQVITIYGNDTEATVLSGYLLKQIFKMIAPVNLVNLHLINAMQDSNGGAFVNYSNLSLRDIVLKNNYEGVIEKPFTNYGSITILPGTTVVKK